MTELTTEGGGPVRDARTPRRLVAVTGAALAVLLAVAAPVTTASADAPADEVAWVDGPVLTAFDGDRPLSGPMAVERDADGALLVGDYSANAVLRDATDGLRTLHGIDVVANPSSLARLEHGGLVVGRGGERPLLLLGPDGARRGEVAAERVTRGDGVVTPRWRAPSALVPLPDGDLLVADAGTGVLTRVDPATGEQSDPATPARWATAVAASRDGRTLWVADVAWTKARDRETARVLAVDTVTGAVEDLAFPVRYNAVVWALEQDARDGLVALDQGTGRLLRHDPATGAWQLVATGVAGRAFTYPTDVTTAADGSIAIADFGSRRVAVVRPAEPWDVAPEPDPEPQPQPDPEPQPDPDPVPQPEVDPDPVPQPDPDPDVPPQPQPQPQPEPQPQPDPDVAPLPDPDADPSPDAEPVPLPTVGPERADATRVATEAADAPPATTASGPRLLASTGAAGVAGTAVTATLLVLAGVALHGRRRRASR